jgi:hypothetical protein
MFKSKHNIQKEVEQIKQVLLPSKVVICHMWLPDSDPLNKMSESEIIAKGLREHRSVIIVPLSEKPNPSELKEYLKTMAREEAKKE